MAHSRSDSASSTVSFDLPTITAPRPPIVRRATPFPCRPHRSSSASSVSDVNPAADPPRAVAMDAWPSQVLTSFPTLGSRRK